MVVTNGVERAIQYFHAISGYLTERKSQYQAIVAFSLQRLTADPDKGELAQRLKIII